MADSWGSRLMHAWNAFAKPTQQQPFPFHMGGDWARPDRPRFSRTGERSIVGAVYTRLAIDAASARFEHVRLDADGRYIETISSGLNHCLTVEANIDQDGRALMQDAVMTMCDKGVIAIVPVDTTQDPGVTASFDVQTMRVGTILKWFPRHVLVEVYNDRTGKRQEVLCAKNFVAIIENPLYAVMNEPNSTLQRLIHKLNLLDSVDEAASSGKLDIILQLPYVIKSDSRKEQAEKRSKDIEVQLRGSKYGIAYIDGTERITQLNRPAENNLLAQITYLTNMLYSQLGISERVLDGTADEQEMLNYYNRTVEPILSAVTNGMARTFLTKTARSQGQAIKFFRDPFKFVPVEKLAEIVDKFTRNEIASSNEFRAVMGWKPDKNPKSDQLVNSNLNQPEAVTASPEKKQLEPPPVESSGD